MYVTGLALAPIDAAAPWTACRSALGQAGQQDPARTQYVVVGHGGTTSDVEGADDELATFCGELALTSLRERGADPVLLNHACASVLFGLEYGQALIRANRADRVVVTGMIGPTGYDRAGMRVLRALSTGRARPFAPDRDGTALGSGQYAVVCDGERTVEDHATAAFARIESISCRVAAEPRAGLRPEAVYDRMVDALDRAGVRAPDRIEAHATGTVAGDAAEEEAISRLLADRGIPADTVVVSASKATTGHLLHGAGAVSLIEACRHALASNGTVLVNAFGFSGNYACAVVGPPTHGVRHDHALVPELIPHSAPVGGHA